MTVALSNILNWLRVGPLILAGSAVCFSSVAYAQSPIEIGRDGRVQTSGVAALGVSPHEGQVLGGTGKWQALEIDHTLTALLAEDNILFSISPRRGGDVFLMFVVKDQTVTDPKLIVRFSNGYEVKGFHYTGIIQKGTQWGCYVSGAEGRAVLKAVAQSNGVTMTWKTGKKYIPFDHGATFVQSLSDTAREKAMPFPR